MRRYIASLLAVLSLGLLLGVLATGTEDVIKVRIGEPLGFHTEYYNCYRTRFFQLCEPLPVTGPTIDVDESDLQVF
jgi:hypothetical protein